MANGFDKNDPNQETPEFSENELKAQKAKATRTLVSATALGIAVSVGGPLLLARQEFEATSTITALFEKNACAIPGSDRIAYVRDERSLDDLYVYTGPKREGGLTSIASNVFIDGYTYARLDNQSDFTRIDPESCVRSAQGFHTDDGHYFYIENADEDRPDEQIAQLSQNLKVGDTVSYNFDSSLWRVMTGQKPLQSGAKNVEIISPRF